MNKDLLFMLNGGEEFIKGIYEASEEKVYFLSADENKRLKDLKEYTSSLVCIFEENRLEIELLISEIEKDINLISKIKNNKANKLMFVYNNIEFEQMKE